MDKGVVAPIRRFPFQGLAIEERAARDEEFRDRCTDCGGAAVVGKIDRPQERAALCIFPCPANDCFLSAAGTAGEAMAVLQSNRRLKGHREEKISRVFLGSWR